MQTVSEGSRHPSQGSTILAMQSLIFLLLLAVPLSAHTSDEAREWQVRSRLKKSRPDLLIGSPLPTRTARHRDW